MSAHGLQYSFSIYIPSTTDVDVPLSPDIVETEVRNAQRLLSWWFGGTTTTTATGSWWSVDKAKLVIETVVIVKSFSETSDIHDKRLIIDYATGLKNRLSQEAVSIEIDGVLDFI